jgi:hypothetical protein
MDKLTMLLKKQLKIMKQMEKEAGDGEIPADIEKEWDKIGRLIQNHVDETIAKHRAKNSC